jgi:hypothetical protein
VNINSLCFHERLRIDPVRDRSMALAFKRPRLSAVCC